HLVEAANDFHAIAVGHTGWSYGPSKGLNHFGGVDISAGRHARSQIREDTLASDEGQRRCTGLREEAGRLRRKRKHDDLIDNEGTTAARIVFDDDAITYHDAIEMRERRRHGWVLIRPWWRGIPIDMRIKRSISALPWSRPTCVPTDGIAT